MKFGGTSVGCGERVRHAAAFAASQEKPLAIVVSAIGGTTDALLEVAEGDPDEEAVVELKRRHLEAAREAVGPEHLSGVEARLEGLFAELESILRAGHRSTAARSAAIATLGERLSAAVFVGALASLGQSAEVAEDPIATDPRYEEAEVDAERTRLRARKHVEPLLGCGRVAVVPGYVGRSPDGEPTTLGRGGSDLTATALGGALGAGRVEILTDVDGVLSADPALVPEAHLIPYLSCREAALFSALGAKVLHPRTMEPVAGAGMEVVVRSSFNPDLEGTRISGDGIRPGIHSLGVRRGVGVVCVGSPVDGEMGLGLEALSEAGIESFGVESLPEGILFTVRGEDAEEALRVLHRAVLSEAVEEVA
jgi:aspartate kinase